MWAVWALGLVLCAGDQKLVNYRGGDGTVLAQGGTYNYVPSIMQDGLYRVWWCAGCEGDCVFYSQSASLDGGWSQPFPVFKPTLRPSDFDGQHTCDPSVLRVGGVTYLYYGGFPLTPSPTPQYTAIGLATSTNDGASFERANGGRPIITAALKTTANLYGAGQPSVIHLDGLFYIVYTDTTGRDSSGSGNWVYVLRSPDPTFQSPQTEELRGLGGGFFPYFPANHTAKAFFPCASVDWLYSDMYDTFVLGCDGFNSAATSLLLFNRNLSVQINRLDLAGHWTEGPGFLKRPDQHAPFLPYGASMDVMRSVGPGGPATWTLGHNGADLVDSTTPAQARVVAALEGYLVEVPGLPLTLVVGGLRLQWAIGAPALRLARAVAPGVNSTVFYWIPFGGSVQPGQTVLGAPNRPAAFLLDDNRLWPVSCLEVITDNGSQITEISDAEFDSHPAGPSLFCISS